MGDVAERRRARGIPVGVLLAAALLVPVGSATAGEAEHGDFERRLAALGDRGAAADHRAVLDRAHTYWRDLDGVVPEVHRRRQICADQMRRLMGWRWALLELWETIQPDVEPPPESWRSSARTGEARRRVIPWSETATCAAYGQEAVADFDGSRSMPLEERVVAVLEPTLSSLESPAPEAVCAAAHAWADGFARSARVTRSGADLDRASRLYRLVVLRCAAPVAALFDWGLSYASFERRVEAVELFDRVADRAAGTPLGARAAGRAVRLRAALVAAIPKRAAQHGCRPLDGPPSPMLNRLSAAVARFSRYPGEDELAEARYEEAVAYYKACRLRAAARKMRAIFEQHDHHAVGLFALADRLDIQLFLHRQGEAVEGIGQIWDDLNRLHPGGFDRPPLLGPARQDTRHTPRYLAP